MTNHILACMVTCTKVKHNGAQIFVLCLIRYNMSKQSVEMKLIR